MGSSFRKPASATDYPKYVTYRVHVLYLLVLWSRNIFNAYFMNLNLMPLFLWGLIERPMLYWSFGITLMDFSWKNFVCLVLWIFLISSLLEVQNTLVSFLPGFWGKACTDWQPTERIYSGVAPEAVVCFIQCLKVRVTGLFELLHGFSGTVQIMYWSAGYLLHCYTDL